MTLSTFSGPGRSRGPSSFYRVLFHSDPSIRTGWASTFGYGLADSASITIPGLSFLGPTNGYMGGNIYGIWMVTSCEVKGSTATFRLSNDQGADSQTIRLTPAENGGLNYEAIDGNEIKRA